jgi:hypothetical protein
MAKYANTDFDSSALLDTRASKGTVSRETNPGGNKTMGVAPDKDVGLFKDMMVNDVIISTTIDATVDVLTANGYDFFSRKENKSNKKKALELFNTFKFDMNFDDVVDNLSRTLLSYGMGFMELRSTKKKILKELYILETSEMRINYDNFGTIHGYFQTGTNAQIEFKPSEVIYFRIKPFGSRVYPLWPLEPIAREYATNIHANVFLQSVFKNIPPHMMYILKNANSTQRKTFIQNLQIVKQNPSSDLVAIGDADVKTNIPAFDNGLMEVLRWLRQQIFAVTRVPPFWLGILEDAANRGNAEAQIFAFETRIKKIQQVIENKINSELLPAMGAKDMVFKFNPFSLKDEKTLLENAEKLKALGVKKKKIAEFLTTRGLTIDAEDIEDQPEGNEKLTRDLVSMNRPRMNKKDEDLKSNIDKSGTSALTPLKAKNIEQRSAKETLIMDGYDQYEEEVLKYGRLQRE